MMDKKLEALLAKQEIAETLYLIARGTDRQDVALFASGFHEDAADYHGLANGPVKNILGVLGQSKLLASQHSITNILIDLDLDGEVAHVECCFNAFHQSRDEAGTLWDEELRGRYFDRFERRADQRWLIAERTVLWDWSRLQPSRETWIDRVSKRPGAENRFIYGRRDKSDMVYTRRRPDDFEQR